MQSAPPGASASAPPGSRAKGKCGKCGQFKALLREVTEELQKMVSLQEELASAQKELASTKKELEAAQAVNVELKVRANLAECKNGSQKVGELLSPPEQQQPRAFKQQDKLEGTLSDAVRGGSDGDGHRKEPSEARPLTHPLSGISFLDAPSSDENDNDEFPVSDSDDSRGKKKGKSPSSPHQEPDNTRRDGVPRKRGRPRKDANTAAFDSPCSTSKPKRGRSRVVTAEHQPSSDRLPCDDELPLQDDEISVRNCAHAAYSRISSFSDRKNLDTSVLAEVIQLMKTDICSIAEAAAILIDCSTADKEAVGEFIVSQIVFMIRAWQAPRHDLSRPRAYATAVQALNALALLSGQLCGSGLLGAAFGDKLVSRLLEELQSAASDKNILTQGSQQCESKGATPRKWSNAAEQDSDSDDNCNEGEDGQVMETDEAKNILKGHAPSTYEPPPWAVAGAAHCGWWSTCTKTLRISWLFSKMLATVLRCCDRLDTARKALSLMMQPSVEVAGDLRPTLLLSFVDAWPDVLVESSGECLDLRIDAAWSVLFDRTRKSPKWRRLEDGAALERIAEVCRHAPASHPAPSDLLERTIDQVTTSAKDRLRAFYSGSGVSKVCTAVEFLSVYVGGRNKFSSSWIERLLHAMEEDEDEDRRQLLCRVITAVCRSCLRKSPFAPAPGEARKMLAELIQDERSSLALRGTASTCLLMLSGNITGNDCGALDWAKGLSRADGIRQQLPDDFFLEVLEMRSRPCGHVINLRRREDRFSHVCTHAMRYGFQVTRVDAIDGKSPSTDISPQDVGLQWDTKINSM
jgi:hypothetical protein